MWLVIAAMRRPITILVLILSIILCAIIAIRKMAIDIFPTLGLPVIYVAQTYGGLSPSQMEGYLSSYYEYHFLYITGIKEVQSKSIQGISLIRLTFQPGTNMSQAVAETVSYVNRARAFMPPGTVSPFIMRFDAGSVPVGNLVFSSNTRSLGEIQDLALFKVRPMFASLPGVSAPPPIGGNQRTVIISVDPAKLRQYNLSPDQVVNAVATGNIIIPAGNVGIGDTTWLTPLNGVVENIQDLGNIPIKLGAGPAIYLRDIGQIENGSDILSSFALVNGKRAIYIPVTKRADASTWSVVQEVKKALPSMQDAIPSDIHISYEFDQSGIVKNALTGLIFEGILGAILTGLMVLLFLRDLCSALIVMITIPIALLSSVVALWITGQTMNIMTLGGLALAVGILVDEATVTIENIHSHLEHDPSLAHAVIESGRDIALPKLLVLVCVLAVFVPAFFMSGVPRALFLPLSLAVGFAMIASYLISQTFVPVMATWVLKYRPQQQETEENRRSFFENLRDRYTNTLSRLFSLRIPIIAVYFLLTFAILILLSKGLSSELFPTVDTGQFKMRLRAPAGTRVEKTEEITLKALDIIRQEVGPNNIETSLAFIGTQPSSYPINTIYIWTSGPQEAILSVALKPSANIRVAVLKEILRKDFKKELPEVAISFEPGDLVSQVTTLGTQTPIEISIIGKSLEADLTLANKLKSKLSKIPYLRDLQFGQPLDYPTLNVNVDRIRAGQLGITVDQVGRSLIAATYSSRFTQPNYWLDKSTGTSYQVQVQVPQPKMTSIEDIKSIPATPHGASGPYIRDIAKVNAETSLGEYDRLNNQRMMTLTANINGNNLGRAANDVEAAIKNLGQLPRGMKINTRGQIQLMADTMSELRMGVLIAIAAIFLLLAANFESFKLSLVVLTTLPAVLAGVIIALVMTGTTLNIQSYMGAIMAMGVSVANAILLVTFAEGCRRQTGSSIEAALQGTKRRMRPILMTAFAMIAGMIPMAMAISEGGEQTAPLGRAVIGGLVASTIATLTILPLIYSIIQAKSNVKSASLDPTDPQSSLYNQSTQRSG